MQGVQVKLCYPLTLRAIPEYLKDTSCGDAVQIYLPLPFTCIACMCVCVYEGSEAVAAKLLANNRANRTVAVLCNHQRAVPKNFSKQMENLQAKVSH